MSSKHASFDVEAYVSNYRGVTRLKRMAFIAHQNTTLKPDVLRAAIDEVRKTPNTALYLELVSLAADTAGASARDDAWVEAEDKRATQRLEKLENDLNQHKTSLVKESIRVHPARSFPVFGRTAARVLTVADGAQRPGRLPLGAWRLRDGPKVLRTLT